MKRLNDADANTKSAKFAGEYLKTRFKSGHAVERNLVLNCVGWGYYMGLRHAETKLNSVRWCPPFYLFIKKSLLQEKNLVPESLKASKFLIKEKELNKATHWDLELARVIIAYGFREAVKAIVNEDSTRTQSDVAV